MCQQENDYQKSTTGRDGDYRPRRCKCQPFQDTRYVVVQGQFKQAQKDGQPLTKK